MNYVYLSIYLEFFFYYKMFYIGILAVDLPSVVCSL